jgi:NTP pyrophosphatase (non-canonical NTP hydrolase)
MRLDLLPKTLDGKLDKVVEEAGEFLQAYGKFRAFGAHPRDEKTGIAYDNVRDIKRELEDLMFAVIMARTAIEKDYCTLDK